MHKLNSRSIDNLLYGFYATVATSALVGQVLGAHETLHFPVLIAVPAVAVIELGGIALAAYGDYRRRLGERAYAAQILSLAVAAYAVGFNWVTHADTLRAVFFAGMSTLGYLVWLLHSGARRRDQLRAAGNLPELPPVYGWWRWITQPRTVVRARALAQADPTLGLYGSLAAVAAQDASAKQSKALSALLHQKVAAGKSKLEADIAVAVFDLDVIAQRLRADADYDKLTAIIGADLIPAKVAGAKPGEHTCESKAAGGRYTDGCERCEVLKAQPRRNRPKRRSRKQKQVDQQFEAITGSKVPANAPTSPAVLF